MIPILALMLAGAADASPSEGLALEAIRNFSACAVKSFPDRAATLLDMDPNSDEYSRRLSEFVRSNSRCVLPNHKLGSTSLPFAGAIAEALITQRYANVPLEKAVAVPKISLNEVSEIGQCVSRKDPAAVAAVLKSVPGTREEIAALNATGPFLSGCVQRGKTMKLNRVSARAIYALGAYRAYSGPPAPAATTTPSPSVEAAQ